GSTIHWFWPDAPATLHRFAHASWMLASKAWWGLLTGILAFAILSRFPRELVAAILGSGGSFSGLLRAVGAGVLLDLCNHGILMVGMGLYRRGISLGQTVTFLIASPWNSLSLTLILGALIGWKWMGLFIVLSMVVALITGWLVDRLVAAGRLPANPNAVDLPLDYRMRPAILEVIRSLKPGFRNYGALLSVGLRDSSMILRWIFFGFVLTALIQACVPDDWFRDWFGPSVAGLLLTLMATTVIEICSEGSSPIAADLLNRGGAPGNAFVFLMAGVATDYTEMMALRETTCSWRASFALPIICVPQILIIGWLIQTAGS
ncbi:MAG: permease, partial [Luteolibacter sp.]